MRRMLVTTAALALLLSACEMRAEILVRPDGSGTMGMVIAMPESLRSMIPDGQDPFGDLRSQADDSPFPMTVEPYRNGGLEGVRATFEFDDVQDLTRKMQLLDETEGGDGFGPMNLRKTATGWTFAAMPDPQLSGGFGGSFGAGEEELGGDLFEGVNPLEGLGSLLTIAFEVTLPGAPGEHNATEARERDGSTTFVWKVTSDAAQGSMRATTVGFGGAAASSPARLLLIAAAMLAAGGVAWALRRNRHDLGGTVLEGAGFGETAPPSSGESLPLAAGSEGEDTRS